MSFQISGGGMKTTDRLEYFLKQKSKEFFISVFEGNLRENIHLWVADQIPGGNLTVEEKNHLDRAIQEVGGGILKMIRALGLRDGVFIDQNGPYQGQEGVIVEVPLQLEQDKRKMIYRVQTELPGQPGVKIMIECLAYELVRKQGPKGVLAPGWGGSGAPLTPHNRPRH
jgi:hypothetical protein